MTLPAQGQPAAPGQTPPAAPSAPVGPPGGAMLTGGQLNIRIAHADPAFPPELWGKTLGEAMRYYSVMKADFMRNNQQQQGQRPLQGEPQQPQHRQPQQPAQQPQGYQPPSFGYTPPQQPQAPAGFDPNAMKQMIEEAVAGALGPINQVTAESVMQSVARRFPDWATYHQEIISSVAGADPRQLLSPALWESAYFHAKGRVLSDPTRTTPQYVPQANQDPFNPQTPDAIRTPPPPVFTESPMPSAPANQNGSSSSDAPEDFAMAQRFGISVQEYRAWKDGRVPPVPQQNNGGMTGQPAPQTQYPPSSGWR